MQTVKLEISDQNHFNKMIEKCKCAADSAVKNMESGVWQDYPSSYPVVDLLKNLLGVTLQNDPSNGKKDQSQISTAVMPGSVSGIILWLSV